MKAFDRLTLVLPLITIVLIALSLWLSVNRRRTLLQLAVGVSLLMIVERRVVLHEQSALASAAHNPQVAQSVLGDLLHGYFVLTAWVLGVALVVLVIAVLSGPYRWAVAFRSRVTRTWRSITAASSGGHRGQVVTWMASHAAGLQLAGAVVAGILLLIVPVWWLSFLIIGVLLAAYEIYLQRIKPPPPDEAPPASGPGNQAGPPVSHRRNLDKSHPIPRPVERVRPSGVRARGGSQPLRFRAVRTHHPSCGVRGAWPSAPGALPARIPPIRAAMTLIAPASAGAPVTIRYTIHYGDHLMPAMERYRGQPGVNPRVNTEDQIDANGRANPVSTCIHA